MDLKDLILSGNKQTNTLIQKETDPTKYDEIASKLCDKRRTIEKKLDGNDIDAVSREENALSLIQIKQDMTIFGITEIDYQAYIAQTKEQEEIATQATLFS